MKPSPGDHRHRLLISGDELRELQRHTGSMAEAFGLDRKIESYKGTPPLTLYRWDLDCLMAVIDNALRGGRDDPDRPSSGRLALQSLGERLRREYDAVYGHEKTSPGGEKRAGVSRTRRKPVNEPGPVFQIKVTLADTKPPIWRRILVRDGTLDTLHEHIQTAMGWTNSHLHHFRIGDLYYGDPALMAENFEDMGYEDSTTTRLSDLVPKAGGRFRFGYEYDFGDSWDHEVVVEKTVGAEPGRTYPVCVSGARACPPEDVGGTGGYADFLGAIRDEGDERHGEMLEWVGGAFDPDAFDPAEATRGMAKGLPDWRRMT